MRCDVCDGLRPGAAVGPVVGGGALSSGGGGGGGKKGKVKGRKVSLTAVGGGGVRGIDEIVNPGRSSRSAWGA